MKKAIFPIFILIVWSNFKANHLQAEPFQLAGHAEIALFRETNASAIKANKGPSNLEAFGTLKVLNSLFDENKLDGISFSRLVLGIMSGYGFEKGVTKDLTFSAEEKKFVQDLIKKAAKYVRNLQFTKNDIWYKQPTDEPITQQHTNILNQLVNGAIPAEPHFEYQARMKQEYKNIDLIIDEITNSFLGKSEYPMVERAKRLIATSPAECKSFIVCFSMLSPPQQHQLFEKYSEELKGVFLEAQRDECLFLVALQCQNIKEALEFIGPINKPINPPIPVNPPPAININIPKAQPQAAEVHAPANEDNVDLTKIDMLLNELRQFENSSGAKRYDDVSKTIGFMKVLFEKKEDIMNFAKDNWENLKSMRDIDAVAHPILKLKISKGSNPAEYLRALLQDYAYKVQGPGGPPVFEKIEWIFGVSV